MLNVLQMYYPLSVRWELKDGRQFIAENIDVRAAMQTYFKTHDIQLQWQREKRASKSFGDYVPAFVHEVKDDGVVLKWLVTLNLTPVAQRFSATGAANKWHFKDEEYIVTTIQGTPTSGIDFDKKWLSDKERKQ